MEGLGGWFLLYKKQVRILATNIWERTMHWLFSGTPRTFSTKWRATLFSFFLSIWTPTNHKAFHLIFYFPKQFFFHMRKIACKICMQFIFYKHFSTPNIWCLKTCIFLDTERSVSRIVNIFRHRAFGVQKVIHFWTPNSWCRELSTFFDTERSVSKKVYISGHRTLGVENCQHFSTPNVRCREMQHLLYKTYIYQDLNLRQSYYR